MTQTPKISRRSQVTRGKTSIIIANVLLALIFLMPLYWTFISSLKDKVEIYAAPPTLVPQAASWDNYVRLFTTLNGAMVGYLRNSLVVDGCTIVAVAVISTLAGFAFSRLELFAKKLWMALILFTMMVPFQALMVPLYNTMSQLKLLNSLACMVLIYTTYQTPFCVYMMKNSFDMIPKAMQEAAHLDGAGSFDIFRRIYLPLAMPGLVTAIVYTAYTTWNDYLIALTFGGTNWKTFNVGIADMALQPESVLDWGAMTAGSIVSLLPIMILFLCLQKYFVKGMMSGAVK